MDIIDVIIYNNQVFKSYDDYYYVSNDGEVYSKYKKGLLKHYIDLDGYHRVDIHRKHIKIHILVYKVWVGDIPNGKQINHFDDNKNNNHYKNLYLGTQKENILDCIRNNHRVGNKKSITIFDKYRNVTITFSTIREFLKYTGHSILNGSISHVKDKKWFKKQFEIIE